MEGVIDVHYASLASRRVQHRVFFLDGHPSRYQPRPMGLNFGEQTGTGVFPLVIAVHRSDTYTQHRGDIYTQQAPVVQTMDSAIHRINRYPLDK